MTIDTIATMSYIPLQTAYLCQDCDAVGNCSTQCPACASEALLALACVYDRKEAEASEGKNFFLVAAYAA